MTKSMWTDFHYINLRMNRYLDSVLAHAGITSQQFVLMSLLSNNKNIAITELAALFGADRTSVSRTNQPLIRDGMIRLAPKGEDGRCKIFVLTEKGTTTLAAAQLAWDKANIHFNLQLQEKGIDKLPEMLSVFAKSLYC